MFPDFIHSHHSRVFSNSSFPVSSTLSFPGFIHFVLPCFIHLVIPWSVYSFHFFMFAILIIFGTPLLCLLVFLSLLLFLSFFPAFTISYLSLYLFAFCLFQSPSAFFFFFRHSLSAPHSPFYVAVVCFLQLLIFRSAFFFFSVTNSQLPIHFLFIIFGMSIIFTTPLVYSFIYSSALWYHPNSFFWGVGMGVISSFLLIFYIYLVHC